MRALFGVVAILALCVCADTAAGQTKIDAKKLVGKWQPIDGPKSVDVTIEFDNKGKMIFQLETGGKTEKLEGSYKLDGDKLEMAVTIAGKEQKETFTLTRLTDEEMAGKTKDGKEEKYKRVKAK